MMSAVMLEVEARMGDVDEWTSEEWMRTLLGLGSRVGVWGL